VAASRSSSAATAVARARSSAPIAAVDAERRARLLSVKLVTLAREQLGLDGAAPSAFPGGAALVAGDRAVVLAQDDPERALGPAMAWARQAGADRLDLLVEGCAGLLARRAGEFTDPPAVWWVQDRELHPVDAEPLGPAPEVSAADVDLAAALRDAGIEVVVEHGVVSGEVLGLEVARVVDGRVEVGVGRHDREAFAMLHGDVPPAEALRTVVDAVRANRRPGGPDHPLMRLAQERWLREVVLRRPDLAGAAALERHEGPRPRPGVKDAWPAIAVGRAVGEGAGGGGVVVACSVGIDVDLVPFAADARLAAQPGAGLVLVVPERDDHPVTRALAARLRVPAEVVAVPGDWRAT
jgi:hypothetical protein